MYSGEYDACVVTLSGVYPHRASLKNMPDHGGNRTYDLWNTSPISGTGVEKIGEHASGARRKVFTSRRKFLLGLRVVRFVI
jgi:hypothetical protein